MGNEATTLAPTSTVSPSRKIERYVKIADVALLRPIDSEEQYERVLAVIDELAPRTNRTAEEDDYLLMLSWIMEWYEAKHYAIDTSELSVLEILQYMMEESGMTGSDLGRLLGHRELGGKILRGERKLSKKHIQSLARHFKVSPSLFLEEA